MSCCQLREKYEKRQETVCRRDEGEAAPGKRNDNRWDVDCARKGIKLEADDRAAVGRGAKRDFPVSNSCLSCAEVKKPLPYASAKT